MPKSYDQQAQEADDHWTEFGRSQFPSREPTDAEVEAMRILDAHAADLERVQFLEVHPRTIRRDPSADDKKIASAIRTVLAMRRALSVWGQGGEGV